MRSKLAIILTVAVILAAAGFIGGVVVTGRQFRAAAPKSLQAALDRLNPPPRGADFQQLLRVWDSLHREYVNADIDDQALLQGALAGLVGGLDDPYSVYLTAPESQRFSDEIAGTFEGVGMEVGFKNNRLTVIAPLEGSPAAKAGLQPGDVLVTIDQRDASGLSVDEAVKSIRGPKDTTVTLTVQRGTEPQTRRVKIIRGTIVVNPVAVNVRSVGDKRIAHVRISSFPADTGRLLRTAMTALGAERLDGYVLDLRSNPGGYLTQAVEVTSVFLAGGRVVTEVNRGGQQETFSVKGNALRPTEPLVVLVNGGSASASEIVAGALQDNRRAKIVGAATFGKGTVQDYQTLPDGSSLKLTVAKWLTPQGVSISEHGITPDVLVDLTADDIEQDRDPQLRKAEELLTAVK